MCQHCQQLARHEHSELLSEVESVSAAEPEASSHGLQAGGFVNDVAPSSAELGQDSESFTIGGLREIPVPGRKCPNCYARGQTIWVIPGKRCPQCGTEVA